MNSAQAVPNSAVPSPVSMNDVRGTWKGEFQIATTVVKIEAIVNSDLSAKYKTARRPATATLAAASARLLPPMPMKPPSTRAARPSRRTGQNSLEHPLGILPKDQR